jgi:hypothetical protein
MLELLGFAATFAITNTKAAIGFPVVVSPIYRFFVAQLSSFRVPFVSFLLLSLATASADLCPLSRSSAASDIPDDSSTDVGRPEVKDFFGRGAEDPGRARRFAFHDAESVAGGLDSVCIY